MARQRGFRASRVPPSCRGAVIAGSVRAEDVRRITLNLERDLVADLHSAEGIVFRSDRLSIGKLRVDERSLAEAFDKVNLALCRPGTVDDGYGLRPHADAQFAVRETGRRNACLDGRTIAKLEPRVIPTVDGRREQAHCGRADELGDEDVRGLAIDLHWRADLLDPA